MSTRPPWADRLLPILVSQNEQYGCSVREFVQQVLREGELPSLMRLMARVEEKANHSNGPIGIVCCFALLAMGQSIEQALRPEGGSGEQEAV